jgi:two-component system, OmpR family, response regulator ChvI
MDTQFKFKLFPVAGLSTEQSGWNIGASEISFSGKVQNYCICMIDMIGSTRVSAELTPSQLSRYYELFLNAIALIAKNFGAKIVKNAGDALIFYFEEASDPKNIARFRNVLDCGLTMGMASSALNAKMLNEKLPPVKYRISADYGQVSVARSQSSQSEDLFGPAMNNTAKINAMARPNGLIIGQGLYEVVKGLKEYAFASAELVSGKNKYSGYHVDTIEKVDVINPFERKPSRL